jgi:putative ABC transport system permease protein
MSVIPLSLADLALAMALLLVLGFVSWRGALELERPLLVATVRLVLQLALVALVLEAVFAIARLHWIALISLLMLAISGREIHARQKRPFTGAWGYGIGTVSMFLSAFALTLFALLILVRPQPWYQPQYAIPMLGMLLGNTMTGIALALERLTDGAWRQRGAIEAQLILGASAGQALAPLRRDSVRAGLIPTLNAMAAAGVVSLPGMMTGQILAGSPPAEAVRYQILIFLLIAVATGGGTLIAVALASRRLFDDRHRLRVDRLRARR